MSKNEKYQEIGKQTISLSNEINEIDKTNYLKISKRTKSSSQTFSQILSTGHKKCYFLVNIDFVIITVTTKVFIFH